MDDSVLAKLQDCNGVVIGTQQVKRDIKQGKLKQIVLAIDTELEHQRAIVELCIAHNITVFRVSSSKLLGQAVGIDVAASCVGIVEFVLV